MSSISILLLFNNIIQLHQYGVVPMTVNNEARTRTIILLRYKRTIYHHMIFYQIQLN